MGKSGRKVILISLVMDLLVIGAKFTGALISGSASLLAEAVHSTIDGVNEVLLLVGEGRSRKPPTKKHPLGHGREVFFWSFVVTCLLFSLGGVFNIYEGFRKLRNHQEVKDPIWSLTILLVSFVLEYVSYRVCLKEIKSCSGRQPIDLWNWFKNSSASDLLVLLTANLASTIGVPLAAAGVSLSWMTMDSRWDAYGSLAVGSLLVLVALFLGREIKSLIIGEAPVRNYKKEIEALMEPIIPGGHIVDLIAVQIGVRDVIINGKVFCGDVRDVERLISSIGTLEKKISARFPEIRWQFIEPAAEKNRRGSLRP